MNTEAITGHCLCGAVRITVGAAEHGVGACHCAMCQRWTGALFLTFSAAAASVGVTGDVRLYASSAFAERAFCPQCGSHLWMRDTDGPDRPYDLMPGLFAAAGGWPLQSEIYIDQVPDYVALAGDHSRKTAAEYERDSPSVEDDR